MKFIFNFSYIAFTRFVTLVVPLVTYPYLLKTMGEEKYGLTAWALTIVNFVTIFVAFGFGYTATKKISINRNSPEHVSIIVSETFYAKSILALISLIIMMLSVEISEPLKQNAELFFLTYLVVLAEVFSPYWYFQGVEKMQYNAMLIALSKIAFSFGVYYFIQNGDQYIRLPVINGLTSIFSSLLGLWVMYKKYNIRPKIVSCRSIYKCFSESWHLYGLSATSSIKENLIIIYTEKYLGFGAVAYVDIVTKLFNVAITPFHIIASVIYPHLSYVSNAGLVKYILYGSFAISSAVFIFTLRFDCAISSMILSENNCAIGTMLKYTSLGLIFATVSSLIGVTIMAVSGMNKGLLISGMGSLAGLFLLLFIVKSSGLTAVYWISLCIAGSFFIEMIIRIYWCKKLDSI